MKVGGVRLDIFTQGDSLNLWLKLDDKFWRNTKMRRLSHAARGVFADMLSFCGDTEDLTGFLTTQQALDRAAGPGARRLVAEIHANENLEAVNGGYLIHDFEDYLPKTSRERTRQWRERKRQEAVMVTSPKGHKPVTVTRDLSRARDGTPVPVPVPVVLKAPPRDRARLAQVVRLDDPVLQLQLWWQDFRGGQISEHDKQAASVFVLEHPRLGLNGIEARIIEHAAWRAEHNKPPLGKLEFYRDTLREQENHLADSGVQRPRESRSAGMERVGEVLAR